MIDHLRAELRVKHAGISSLTSDLDYKARPWEFLKGPPAALCFLLDESMRH